MIHSLLSILVVVVVVVIGSGGGGGGGDAGTWITTGGGGGGTWIIIGRGFTTLCDFLCEWWWWWWHLWRHRYALHSPKKTFQNKFIFNLSARTKYFSYWGLSIN